VLAWKKVLDVKLRLFASFLQGIEKLFCRASVLASVTINPANNYIQIRSDMI